MNFDIKLDNRFKKSFRATFNRYNLEVGILRDKNHKKPRRWTLANEMNGGRSDLGQYAGGLVRKTAGNGNLTVREVSEKNRQRLGFNFYTKPFEDRTDEVVIFLDTFFNYAFGKTTVKRLENTLQACVRNPILRGDYGPQSKLATTIKGFYRPMIDTGQLFKGIMARVKKKGWF